MRKTVQLLLYVVVSLLSRPNIVLIMNFSIFMLRPTAFSFMLSTSSLFLFDFFYMDVGLILVFRLLSNVYQYTFIINNEIKIDYSTFYIDT